MAAPDDLHRRFTSAWFMNAVRREGVLPAMAAAPSFAAKHLRLWWWDRRHHVSTRHRVFMADLGLSGPSADHARPYEATDTTVLPRLLRQLPIDHARYTFIDLGAGKGQALFLAAGFPFKRIIGVELSPALCEIARRNRVTFRSRAQACTAIAIVCGDAADFRFPVEPLLVYLFNSFDHVVLARVLANLTRSIEGHPREAYLVYHNPRHRDVVERFAPFERVLSGIDERDFRHLTYEVFRAAPALRTV
jgi:SAM-dependent methyltransferase